MKGREGFFFLFRFILIVGLPFLLWGVFFFVGSFLRVNEVGVSVQIGRSYILEVIGDESFGTVREAYVHGGCCTLACHIRRGQLSFSRKVEGDVSEDDSSVVVIEDEAEFPGFSLGEGNFIVLVVSVEGSVCYSDHQTLVLDILLLFRLFRDERGFLIFFTRMEPKHGDEDQERNLRFLVETKGGEFKDKDDAFDWEGNKFPNNLASDVKIE